MNSKIVFITGTDTHVGKTVATSLLTKALVNSGIKAAALKPMETGCLLDSNMELVPEDAKTLLKANGQGKLEDVILYRYSLPLAPAVSERIEQKELSLVNLKKFISTQASKNEITLVETAGGLLVPIKDSYSSADLIREFEAGCVVVIGNRLGCLNHASLTFEALKNRGIKTIGYILNDFLPASSMHQQQQAALSTNREMLVEVGEKYQIKELAYLSFFSELESSETHENEEVLRLKKEFLANI